MPKTLKKEKKLSKNLSLKTADKIPNGIPTNNANKIETNAKTIVLGNALNIKSDTKIFF